MCSISQVVENINRNRHIHLHALLSRSVPILSSFSPCLFSSQQPLPSISPAALSFPLFQSCLLSFISVTFSLVLQGFLRLGRSPLSSLFLQSMSPCLKLIHDAFRKSLFWVGLGGFMLMPPSYARKPITTAKRLRKSIFYHSLEEFEALQFPPTHYDPQKGRDVEISLTPSQCSQRHLYSMPL